MTPSETLEHLQADGFWGVQCVGAPERVHLTENGMLVVTMGKDERNERKVKPEEFLAQFTGCRFRTLKPCEAVGVRLD